MKKRNKFLIKLGILCTAFVGLITALVVPTHAYTLSNDFVYSSNGLNLENPSAITYSYTDLGWLSNKNSEIWIIPETDDNNLTREFMVEIYEGTTRREIIYRTNINESNSWNFQAIDITNGQSISTMRNFFNDYKIRFSRNGHAADDYVEYNYSDILDYYSQFIDSNTYFSHFGVTFYVRSINVAVPGSINIDHVGVYFANDKPIIDTFETYGIYGNFDESYINTYSYNQGVLSQQTTITNLQNQIDNMDRQIANLSSQLSLAQSTQMRTLLWTIGSTPFESFKSIWDVNVWGVNIGGIIIGGFMALLIIYLIKKVWK